MLNKKTKLQMIQVSSKRKGLFHKNNSQKYLIIYKVKMQIVYKVLQN